MITANGYSKDPSMQPEGIVITFGKEMVATNGGHKEFIKYFIDAVEGDDNYWMHKMTNWPTIEVADVYIVLMNRLWGKVKFGWFEKNAAFAYSVHDNGVIEWPRLCLVGPFERCPFKRELKGFQGFRYCTKLF